MSFLVGGKSCGLAGLFENDLKNSKTKSNFLKEKGNWKKEMKEKNTGYYKGSTGVQR